MVACTYHDFVDQGAFAQGDELRPVEGGRDLAAGDGGDTFDAVEVRVLDGHHAGLAHRGRDRDRNRGGETEGNTERAERRRESFVYLGEDLFGEVVDELPVDETADAVVDDLLALGDGPWSIEGTTWQTGNEVGQL